LVKDTEGLESLKTILEGYCFISTAVVVLRGLLVGWRVEVTVVVVGRRRCVINMGNEAGGGRLKYLAWKETV